MAASTALEISQRVGGTLTGPGDLSITGVEQIDRAGPGQLTFAGDDRHARQWDGSGASALLISRGLQVDAGADRAVIEVDNADLAMAEVLAMFDEPPPRPEPGVAPGAFVDASAKLGAGVAIGHGSYVGPGAVLDDDVALHPGVTVFDETRIGARTVLWSGCVIRERCLVGSDCVLHPNVTVGADGFGYRASAEGDLVRMPHLGHVEIGDRVEIGANSCIDRGKFSSTVIGDQTKIDNLCQVGHNCRIGSACLIAGQVGIAGSVTIGNGVMIGGKVAVKDHLTIGDGATLAGSAALMNDMPAGETWAGYPARPVSVAAREHAAMRRLPELVKTLKRK
ncbi:MAG: UDP-3-O-(3-hydroxymyristoyl)glucosamine N-acyltransferase [Phycisphaeraceae bacterium]|nr:UDP-3-O-(3-hydroxymyristoyl)glucosamine N-acyltransferase [Phycisphaeraceae bacterium]